MKKQDISKNALCVVDMIALVCIFFLMIGVMAVIAFQIEAMIFRYPLDYGEAPLINQAIQLNAGISIYQPDLSQPPFTIANYPPVYVAMLALFETFFGPAFWYGRLLSSLSALGSGLLISLITFARSRNWRLSLIPGLLFVNIPYVASWSTLARIDHMALFWALLGIYLLFRSRDNEKLVDLSLVLAILSLLMAIYTRQSYALAAPLACFLYLFRINWKRSLVFAGILGGLSSMVFIILNIITRGGFYFNIVTANINPFGWERLIDNLRNFFEIIPFIFILGAIGLAVIFNRIEGWPMWIGFAMGGFFSALTIGKVGSNVNYFLELAAALCLVIGFYLWSITRWKDKWASIGMLAFSLILLSWQGIMMIRTVQDDSRWSLESRKESYQDLEAMENMVLQNIERPILADEYMGMIVLSGQNLYLQPFEITQLINAGLFDQEILIREIEEEKFSLILLQEGSWWSYVAQERWTPELIDAIQNNYRLTAQFEHTNVYQPRIPHTFEVPSDCPRGVWPLPTNAYLGYRYRQGLLILYGSGAEGSIPVIAPADGLVYRPETYPEGSLVIVHSDPFEPNEKVITLFEDMLSYRGDPILISDTFPAGAAGIPIKAGEILGYQSHWSGRPYQQDWLHVNVGVAPYDPGFLVDYALLKDNLVSPEAYFGILIDTETTNVRPLKCLP